VLDNDSLRYHGPFVARWLQLHDLTQLHHTSRELQEVFFPANNELLVAGSVLTYGTDWAMPYLNVGWFALALLAAWCLPLDPRRRPLTLVAAAAVVAAPRLIGTQPGSGRNDLAAAALLLAFVAIAHRLGERPGGMAVAGLALGLAVGTKLSVAVPAVVLVVAVVVLHRGRRIATAGSVVLAALVSGGFWYVRNWVRAGNPLPWYRLDIGPIHLDGPRFLGVEEHGQTIVDRAGSSRFWSVTVPDGLRYAIGPLWWVVLVLAAGVVVVGLATGRWRRAIAATVVVALAAHVITPFSAGGDHGPTMFGPQLRFLAAPALLAGVLVALIVPTRHRRWVVWAALVYVASVVASFTDVAVALGFAAAVVGLAAAAGRGWSVPRPARIALSGVAAVLVLAAAPVAAAHRYDDPDRNATWAVFGMFRHVRDARVAVGVFRHTYPLTGPDLSNHVQLVGVAEARGGFRPARTQREWVHGVTTGDYDYVVVGRTTTVRGPELVQTAWSRAIPGAVEVYRDGTTTVFHISGGRHGSVSVGASPGGVRTQTQLPRSGTSPRSS
jgi:hypothetical protein